MTTGQRIKAARKSSGMTQKDLAKKLGLSYQGVAQWENDLRNPKQETLQKIADALDINVSQLKPVEITFVTEIDPEWADLEKKLESKTITPDELKRYKELNAIATENTHKAMSDIVKKLEGFMDKLNQEGQEKAISYLEDLTKIDEYRLLTPEEMELLYPKDKRMMIRDQDGNICWE